MPADRRIILRDTTLREGIQIPGSRIGDERKREFVKLLRLAGVPEIEIGLPDGMSACAALAEFVRDLGGIDASALVPCYAGHWRRQVDMAAEAGLAGIDVLTPVSDQLLREADHYGMTAATIAGKLREVVEYARTKPPRVGVGLIDTCRAPRERAIDLARPLKALGVERLVVYDSVGTIRPSEMTALVAAIREASGLSILAHCHNDYGLATANSLAAVEGGAEAVDVAVNGVGGRAGNAALEEVALALENLYGLSTGVDAGRLKELSDFVQRMTGLSTWPLKPIVGEYCFSHVPVMHIRCIAGGNPSAFEPFDPRQVGMQRRYDFSLPVDYRTALEPLVRRGGCRVAPRRTEALVEVLRRRAPRAGLTEEQVIACIREFAAMEPTDAGVVDTEA